MWAIIFLAIPVVVFVCFLVSLCLYLIARWKNKRKLGAFPEKTVKLFKIITITAGITWAAFITVIIGFFALLIVGIGYM